MILQSASGFVKEKSGSFRCRKFSVLLPAEGLAVGALVLGGVGFVGAHQDPVQGAVVLVAAVVSALLDGAFDALVGVAVHRKASFILGSEVVWLKAGNPFREIFPILLFAKEYGI